MMEVFTLHMPTTLYLHYQPSPEYEPIGQEDDSVSERLYSAFPHQKGLVLSD